MSESSNRASSLVTLFLFGITLPQNVISSPSINFWNYLKTPFIFQKSNPLLLLWFERWFLKVGEKSKFKICKNHFDLLKKYNAKQSSFIFHNGERYSFHAKFNRRESLWFREGIFTIRKRFPDRSRSNDKIDG